MRTQQHDFRARHLALVPADSTADMFETPQGKQHATEAWPHQRAALAAISRELGPDRPILLHIATGGGKTRVANDLIARTLDEAAGPVLWLTKDWQLLHQAARDLAQRHLPVEKLRRIGGEGSVLQHLSEEKAGAGVIYSTIHTFCRRQADGSLPRVRPSLVVWDECHWGEHAASGRHLLRWCRRRRIPLLGLTATPRRPGESAFRIAYSKDFASLVSDGVLAAPRLVAPVSTGVAWSPERSSDRSDFRADSLERLGRNRSRNEQIVRHYAENRARYGPTIVFACSIEHANRLAAALQAPPFGIPARAVHSRICDADNRDSLRAFARGEVDVLINVAMLTHGFDVPAVRTVFLCRPTLSDILFSQMIGRASRLDPSTGKRQFHVVEFTDALDKFGDQLVTARTWFRGTGSNGAVVKPKRRPAQRARPLHRFNLQGQPRLIPDSPAYPEAMRGLWYRQGQTFGVEFELTRDDWDSSVDDATWTATAEPLRRALAEALGADTVGAQVLPVYGSPEKTHEVWNVERDNSCGWEISSRVLSGQEGFREIVRACEALTKVSEGLGLKVNFRTGLHLHIGWFGRQASEIRRALQLARLFEPALATLVSPSRVADFDGAEYAPTRPNRYCRPVSSVFSRRALAGLKSIRDLRRICCDDDDRYVTFNVRPLKTIHTVEIRLHNGTIDAHKTLLWLSLWQQILWAANGTRPIPDVPDRRVLVPDGDIVALVREFLPKLDQPRFIERLERRRREIAQLWRQHPALAPWVAFADRWDEQEPARAAA